VGYVLDTGDIPSLDVPPVTAINILPELTATTSLLNSSGSGADAYEQNTGGTDGASVAGSQAGTDGLTVDQQRNSSVVESGLIAVSVSSSMSTQGSGFSFSMPERLVELASSSLAPAVVTMPNGGELPSWLKFDPELMAFTAAAVPDSGLPLQLQLSIVGEVYMIVISEKSEG